MSLRERIRQTLEGGSVRTPPRLRPLRDQGDRRKQTGGILESDDETFVIDLIESTLTLYEVSSEPFTALFQIDFANETIKLWDAAGTLRVLMGNLGSDYGIQFYDPTGNLTADLNTATLFLYNSLELWAGSSAALVIIDKTGLDGGRLKILNLSPSDNDYTIEARSADLYMTTLGPNFTTQLHLDGLGIHMTDKSATWLTHFGWNTTPVAQQGPLTAANAGAINSGDATTDAVIANMRTRINQLETALQAYGWLL